MSRFIEREKKLKREATHRGRSILYGKKMLNGENSQANRNHGATRLSVTPRRVLNSLCYTRCMGAGVPFTVFCEFCEDLYLWLLVAVALCFGVSLFCTAVLKPTASLPLPPRCQKRLTAPRQPTLSFVCIYMCVSQVKKQNGAGRVAQWVRYFLVRLTPSVQTPKPTG